GGRDHPPRRGGRPPRLADLPDADPRHRPGPLRGARRLRRAPPRRGAGRLRAVRALLDTQVFLWMQQDPDRLGSQLATIADVRNELLLSAVVSWELAIKTAIGRLPLPEPVGVYVPSRIA